MNKKTVKIILIGLLILIIGFVIVGGIFFKEKLQNFLVIEEEKYEDNYYEDNEDYKPEKIKSNISLYSLETYKSNEITKNTYNDLIYTFEDEQPIQEIKIEQINKSKKEFIIYYDKQKLLEDNTTTIEKIKLNAKFKKDIQRIFLANITDHETNKYILFLTEDGTIEYLKVKDINDKKIKYYKVNKIKDIIDFRQAFVCSESGTPSPFSTVFAIRNDGKYYNLRDNILNNKEYKSESYVIYQDIKFKDKVNSNFSKDKSYSLKSIDYFKGISKSYYNNNLTIFIDVVNLKKEGYYKDLKYTYKVNFNKNIRYTELVNIKNDNTGKRLIVLFKDGTLAYVDISNLLQTGEVKFEYIRELRDIFRLVPYKYNYKIDGFEDMDKETILAQDIRGNYYDIEDYIK